MSIYTESKCTQYMSKLSLSSINDQMIKFEQRETDFVKLVYQ